MVLVVFWPFKKKKIKPKKVKRRWRTKKISDYSYFYYKKDDEKNEK